MQRLAAAEDQGGDGQLQGPYQAVLVVDGQRVGLDQAVAVVGDVLVLHPQAVHGVDTHPGAGGLVIVAYHPADVPVAG
ncbi:MAG: hypothetical protein FWH40_04835 [Coriobacteriia bacterium]|nr:hypothetical protein [Coriobacteriia bacterium]